MTTIFPSYAWLLKLKDKLNTDEKYGRIAAKWEGDVIFQIIPDGALEEEQIYYVNLWHGEWLGMAPITGTAVRDRDRV